MYEIDITQFRVPCDKNWLGGGKESTFGPTEDLESGLRSGVYWIYCLANDKVYIGSAVNFRKRWAGHLRGLRRGRHHSLYLQNSWDKYGPSAFAFEVLEFVEPDQLVWREQLHIDAFQAYDREYGFNVYPTAGSPLGMKHTEVSRQKIREAFIGKPRSEETIQKIVETKKSKPASEKLLAHVKRMHEGNRGRKASEEQKLKTSESMRGRKHSEESRQKMREAASGRTHTEETKKKISEIQIGKTLSGEHIQKIREANRGKKRSEEIKQRMCGRVQSEETRRKISEAHRGKVYSEETLQRMREAQRRRFSEESERNKIEESDGI